MSSALNKLAIQMEMQLRVYEWAMCVGERDRFDTCREES